jgi:uncharacterized protein
MLKLLSIMNSIEDSLNMLSKKWKIDPRVFDLHIGKREDVVDTVVPVNGVIFHIPTLTKDNLYVLWKCLWPDCHNCCERQGRLPLTKDDIKNIATKMGYCSKAEFINNETRISSWEQQDYFRNIITTLTMLSLKRKHNEIEEQDGTPIPCRFLNEKGSCTIHPQKPGVCWLYPFASWLETNKGRSVVHATFQLTGDCPGFYTSRCLDDMNPVLEEYSKKIFSYNMAVSRTTRENYGFINVANLKSS